MSASDIARATVRTRPPVFITEGLARNLPPVNSILANSTGEILPSDLTEVDFDEWWTKAAALESFTPAKK